MEQKLYDAVDDGKEEEVRIILRENRNIDVNWGNQEMRQQTVLFVSSLLGHDKIVPMLLAHPDIDVNQKSFSRSTPFLVACVGGSAACVRLLLKDPRVKINEPSNSGYTPLWWAAHWGHLGVIKLWIASGREADLGHLSL